MKALVYEIGDLLFKVCGPLPILGYRQISTPIEMGWGGVTFCYL